ncbi:hypothetical protein C2S51_035558 [Perilla frutescens var. frutescens]|nr:hypothetical protein C2S51_035558 [Perilla frutescens var. frutescens]
MKKQALFALNKVNQEDKRYAESAVKIDGFMNLVVNFLIFKRVARVACLIAGFQHWKSFLTGKGVIAWLIRVLECESKLSKKICCKVFDEITENWDNVWAVSAHGGVTALLKIYSSYGQNGGNCWGDLVLVCGGVENPCWSRRNQEIRGFMVGYGDFLAELARSKDSCTN